MELSHRKKTGLRVKTSVSGNSSGQAVIEYVLVIFLVIMMFTTISKWLSQSNLLTKLVAPVKKDYAILYKYGHIKAKGKEEGGYEHHPEPFAGAYSRIFVNPR